MSPLTKVSIWRSPLDAPKILSKLS